MKNYPMQRMKRIKYCQSWIACFDILGFSEFIKSTQHALVVKLLYDDVLSELLGSCNVYSRMCLRIAWFSDTFIIYSVGNQKHGYTCLQGAAKLFFKKCLFANIPTRGAISFGDFYANRKEGIYYGKALLDAYGTAENQDQIGLVMTKVAVDKANEYNVHPENHGFSSNYKEVSWKENKPIIIDARVYDYCCSQSVFNSLLSSLDSMKKQAPCSAKKKYDNTIEYLRILKKKRLLHKVKFKR